ncbi:hypothetical protein E2C01_077003 [Portunus trituberculatus]|uniref:Uncharacterized protein n=1 Tax=Portunus trituberculatus TaxID=210409 RepID=A0A5B7IQ54_PORTR|nr:hypothetical protein [Portunus trituberculatus]
MRCVFSGRKRRHARHVTRETAQWSPFLCGLARAPYLEGHPTPDLPQLCVSEKYIGIPKRELSELGGCLARVEDLVERARSLQEVVRLGLLQVDQSAARKVLVTSFRQQQQRMHQDVSQ